MRESEKKQRVLALLTHGYITQAEAAALMGVTRQRIHQWIRTAGIHPIIARERLVRNLLRDARP
jgi:transposase-like protein